MDSTVDGSESESARVSYVGRINYSYANKYMLTASVRRDGSMFFAPGKRFGWFPAVSAGWDIAKEDFFMNKISNVQQLKLRASYGLAGQDQLIVDGVNVNQWRWLETYTNGSSMYFGDALQKGIAYSGIVNPLVTWEKSQSINVGVDTRFLENFSVSAEYWNKYTLYLLVLEQRCLRKIMVKPGHRDLIWKLDIMVLLVIFPGMLKVIWVMVYLK